MCEGGSESGLQGAQPQPSGSFSVGTRCMKCEKAAVTTARTKDPFCKECFNAYFVHRFRATFGKVRLFTEGEKVLLAYSGGTNSRVLLGLAEEGLNLSAYKKLRFEPTVVVIDEGAAVGEEWSNRCCRLAKCLAIAAATGFKTVFTRIEQVFSEEYDICYVDQLLKRRDSERKEGEGAVELGGTNGGTSPSVSSTKGSCEETERAGQSVSDCNTDQLEEALCQSLLGQKAADKPLEKRVRALFDSCASVTAKESLLLSLRRQLLVGAACKLGYSKVLLGDTATRLAVRLLGNIAQGKGGTLPLDTGFIDDRVGDIALIRPLREFPVNEVAMYARLNDLQSVFIPHFTTLEAEQASIEQLTESFIAGLQVNFPSTTSTVFRTGDKLTVAVDEKSKRCALCQAPVGTAADTSVFTHLSVSDECDADLWNSLCYGCQLTIKDMKCRNFSSLPPFVDQNRSHAHSLREVPACIKDCLIEETDP